MTSLAISQNSVVSLLLQGVRCNLQSIHSPIPTPKSLKVMQVVWGSRMLSVTRRSTSLREMYGLGPNSRRRANKRAIDVGVRGSVLVLTMVFWNQICPRHHLRSRQLHRLPCKRLRIHAVLANRGRHIPHPHRLLQRAAAVDVDQPGVDVHLTADPSPQSRHTPLPRQQTVVLAEHVCRTDDAGLRLHLAHHLLSFRLRFTHASTDTFVRAHSERCSKLCCSADTCKKCSLPISLQMRAKRSGK